MSEREKIIALARECNVQSLKEPRYHMDIYELTGQAIEAFYHKAQREILEQVVKVVKNMDEDSLQWISKSDTLATIRQLIKEKS